MWFEQIERLYDRRRAASERVTCAPFRSALHLLQLAPRPLAGFLPTRQDEAAIEALLSRGALLEAAIALFGDPLGLSLTRARDGRFEATLIIPGASTAGRDIDAHAGLALLGAWCQASLALTKPDTDAATLTVEPRRAAVRARASLH